LRAYVGPRGSSANHLKADWAPSVALTESGILRSFARDVPNGEFRQQPTTSVQPILPAFRQQLGPITGRPLVDADRKKRTSIIAQYAAPGIPSKSLLLRSSKPDTDKYRQSC
jgi:hypothetical protein